MKKILIRSGVNPLEEISYFDMIRENRLGSNLGNLVYAYSIYKTLWDEETEFILTKYRYDYSQQEIDQINEECNCFIIPLADAVRADFVREMKGLTKLVKSLKIPCFVIGIGVRAPYEPEVDFSYSFDDVVREFLKAVLEKSAIIGVRGWITADYLSRLGFKEERDFTIIGCPSMYTFGGNGIKIRESVINSDSVVCYNENVLTSAEISEFIRKSVKSFKDYYFIPQQVKELKIMYAGASYYEKLPEGFPHNITDDVYLYGKCRFFSDVLSWIEFLKSVDFCFGSRLHGNIVATLAGTPSIIFPFDARARELAEYHGLTSVPYNQIDKDTYILDLVKKVDFHSPEKYQRTNFDHYIDFLNKNNIEHIYQTGRDDKNTFDKKVREVRKRPLESITQMDSCEIGVRLQKFHEWDDIVKQKSQKELKEKIEKLKVEIKKEQREKELIIKELGQKNNKVQEQNRIIEEQNKKLNYRSIKAVMKVRDKVAKTGLLKKAGNK